MEIPFPTQREKTYPNLTSVPFQVRHLSRFIINKWLFSVVRLEPTSLSKGDTLLSQSKGTKYI